MKRPVQKKQKSHDKYDIAIIGLVGRFPQSLSIKEYWNNLCEGNELITFFSDEELINAGISRDLLANPNYIKASPILEDFDKFDAKFFKYPPREAIALDPQHRLLLQCAWETLEHAGYAGNDLPYKVGVFAGSGGAVTSYLLEYEKAYPEIRGATGSFQHLANDKDFLTTRISYKLNLKGPSVDIQTACSTSLVTVHMACQSILAGECDMALAGGVNVRVPHLSGYLRQQGDVYSADGHCRTFDANATGIVFGSGVGLVLLKPLQKALADNDTIYAVIKGSAINNDGGQKVSYTASSANGQEACMLEAFEKASVSPESIHYVEAHGTGTVMGDPVEITALSRAFRRFTNKKQFCAIGSVKTNMGHLDTASGISSLIKTVLMLYHKKIPPNINLNTLNPRIDFKNSPFYIPIKLRYWQRVKTPRRAAVNSLGMGGTNAFMILEEAPLVKHKRTVKKNKQLLNLFTLSAKTDAALYELARRYVDFLNDNPHTDLTDLCYTTNVGRAHFSERLAFLCQTTSDLKKSLQSFINKDAQSSQLRSTIHEGKKVPLAFYFPDHVTKPFKVDWVNLLSFLPEIKIKEYNKSCQAKFKKSLKYLLRETQSKHTPHSLLNHFLQQYLLGSLWLAFGISPTLAIGSGVGTLVAATLSQMITFDQALTILANQINKKNKIASIKPASGNFKVITFNGAHPFNAAIDKVSANFLSPLTLEAVSQEIANLKCEVLLGISCDEANPPFMLSQNVGYLTDCHNLNASILHVKDILQIFIKLYFYGVTVNWEKFSAFYAGKRIALPTYPFQKDKYWVTHKALETKSLENKVNRVNDNLFYKISWIPLENKGQSISSKNRKWLIFAESEDHINELIQKITQHNDQFTLVINHSQDITKLKFPCISVNFDNLRELETSLTSILEEEQTFTDVLYFFTDFPKINQIQFTKIFQTHREIITLLLKSLQQLLKKTWIQLPRIWLFTTSIDRVNEREVNLAYAPLLGFYQTFRAEHTDWIFKHIDFSQTDGPKKCIDSAWDELTKIDAEYRIAYREGKRLVARVTPINKAEISTFHLQQAKKGLLKTLFWKPITEVRSLTSQEVTIEVAATSLNFRDVLTALGLYPGNAPLGTDFAGRIVAISPDVKRFKIGDAVFGFAQGSFASRVNTNENLITIKPDHLTFAEAASIPTIFLTVFYALNHLAKLKSGEKILIHSAAGGIGLAAIQIAKHIGAEIFATVSSDAKRSYLKKLGVQHIYHSRTLDYGREINQDTDGAGLDVVLNTLSGAGFIETTLSTCHPQARFIELGKRNIWDASTMENERPDISYFIVALDKICSHQPELIQQLFEEIKPYFIQGVLKPVPIQTFTKDKTIKAFQTMQKAEHIGKLVIDYTPQLQAVEPFCKSNGSYLITGGLGALGLKIADWLIAHGAKHLVLAARSSPNEKIQSQLLKWQEKEINVKTVTLDVANADEVNKIISKFGNEWPKLFGIIHAAGILDDATLLEQDWSRFENIWQAKVFGGWNLHQATYQLKIDLDFFIFFSSIASALGSAGQINYAAANAFLDALAAYRHQIGLPATAINWGPWGDSGMAVKHKALHERRGWCMLQPTQALLALQTAMASDYAEIIIADLDLPRFKKQLTHDQAWLSNIIVDSPSTSLQTSQILKQLENASLSERNTLLKDHVGQLLKEVLGFSASTAIDDNQGFFDMGLDSLLAIELRNKLQDSFSEQYRLSTTLLFSYPTFAKLMHYLKTEVLSKFFLEKQSVNASNLNAKEEVATTVSYSPQKPGHQEPIAIVGVGCRFPAGANTPENYWHLLESSIDAIDEVPLNRWNNKLYYDDKNLRLPGKISTRFGGFLNSAVKEFDAQFFNISPKEAEMIDPQHRLLLEVTWEALEDAGLAPYELIDSKTGVFIGISTHDFSALLQKAYSQSNEFNAYFAIGNLASAAAGRLAYHFGLKGPAFALDTACSSSLVAIHEACQNLINGSCKLAIAGGVNLMLAPDICIGLSQARMLAQDGHCKVFDAKADGYVRSEGCGIVILKKLSDAELDNDRILGVILGSAINQCGKSSGITVPDEDAQADVINQALHNASISPDEVSYIEAHGTGTSLGDPIEINALRRVYATSHRQNPLLIGAVKSNIGHTEAAAGVAGLLKVIYSLQNEKIPSQLHLHEINPLIDIKSIPAEIPVTLTSWPKNKIHARIAGISSFGFTGSNAHVIVSEPKTKHKEQKTVERAWHILTLSAQNPAALRSLINLYGEYFEKHDDIDLADVAFTANTGRNHFKYRIAIVAQNLYQLKRKLNYEDFVEYTLVKKQDSKLAFIFSKSYCEKISNIKELYATQPIFKDAFDEFESQLKKSDEFSQSLLAVNRLKELSGENRLWLTCAFEYALAKLWISWRIIPDYASGFGIGEFVAAIIAQVVDLKTGIQLIADFIKTHDTQPRNALLQIEAAMKDDHGPTQFLPQAMNDTKPSKAFFQQLIQKKCQLFLGIGTNSAALAKGPLSTFLNKKQCEWLSSTKKENNAIEILFNTLATLYMYGKNVDWKAFDKYYMRNKLSLPTYPFQRKYFWPEVITKIDTKVPATVNKVLTPVTADTYDSEIFNSDDEAIKGVIRNSVKNALGLKEAEIEDDADFLELGMDSIMAMQSIETMQKRFGQSITLALPFIYQYPTIAKLSNKVATLIKQSDLNNINKKIQTTHLSQNKSTNDLWFRTLNEHEDNKIQLFCFPYAGGGPTVFSGWNKRLPNEVGLYLLQLPEREARMNEKSITRFSTLISNIVDSLSKRIVLPFVFIGYSLGAIIAFEVAKELYRRHKISPQHLLVAAMCSPEIFVEQAKEITLKKGKIINLLQTQYEEAIQEKYPNLKRDEKLLKLSLPALTADLRLANDYFNTPELHLSCPITAFSAKRDALHDLQSIKAWSKQTNNEFELITLPGNHFSMIINSEALINHVHKLIMRYIK